MSIRPFLLLTTGLTLAGCASSPVEDAYGDSVRSVVAAQRIEPQPREPELTTDGARLEGVMTIYRTWVGDPQPVVKQRPVEGQ